MRIAAIGLLLSFAALPVQAQTPSLAEPVVMPFTATDGLVFISATLGDSTPLNVILDTGGGLDVLAPSLIRRVGGRPLGVATGHRMTGERLDIQLWVVPSLRVGPLATADAVVGSWDALDSFGLDGIISLMGFREQPFTIDFKAGTVTLESASSLAGRRAAGQVSPLLLDDLRGHALTAFAAFSLGGELGECELDTGTQATRANTRYLAALGIDSSDASVTGRSFKTVTGAMENQYVATVPRVALADAPDVAATGTRVTFSDIIYDCVIGTSFWQGRALTLDIANRELIVSE
jgi:hypothetical protein